MRVLLTGLVLYLYWKFKEGAPAQLAFIAYVGALFVEQWAMARFREKRPQAAETSVADGHGHRGVDRQSPGGAQRESSGGYLSAFVVLMAVLLMSDSFFFTDWLVFGAPGSGEAGGVVLAKVVASLVALVAAFAGPLVAGVVTYIDLAEWISRRRQGSSSFLSGFGPVVPAAVVAIACYGHFYLAYLVYSAMGVLRPG
ncbi:hypothetical protein [Lentzea fradiae]|uniref:hypothetical protein n=1 Tax=Lentzea fradiae TaxID=200378 RepID=UPI00115FD813|nr:hypothetical protein [Lentzea fradiae]